MVQKFRLTVLVDILGTNAYLLGENTAEAKKSFITLNRTINAQLKAVADKVLNRKLNGRKRLELLTSLEEDAVDPGSQSQNLFYIGLKGLAIEVELLAMKVINGETNRMTAFTKKAKQFRRKQNELLKNLGISREAKPRNFVQINHDPHV